MDSKLLSWNINGSKSRFHEVQLIISELNPIVFSVQETNILAPNPHDLDHEGKLKISP
jgi:exonuclease III